MQYVFYGNHVLSEMAASSSYYSAQQSQNKSKLGALSLSDNSANLNEKQKPDKIYETGLSEQQGRVSFSKFEAKAQLISSIFAFWRQAKDM